MAPVSSTAVGEKGGASGSSPGGEPPGAAKARMAKITFALVAYASCSSLMLIINKLAVYYLPAPSVLLTMQLAFSAAAIAGLTTLGVVDADALDWKKAKPFVAVALGFLGALYANVKTLQYANVETFIVFRSSSPILISALDYVFLGRELPNARSMGALAAVACGAAAYVLTDANFEVRAYGWVFVWYCTFAFDQIFIKWIISHHVDTVGLSVWGRSYYTNALSVPPVLFLAMVTNEAEILRTFEWTFAATLTVTASCVMGILMSYSGMLLRGLISATSFTVTGTMCKIGTVVVNCLMWDKHASFEGLAALFVCLFAGMAYQQAPMRGEGGAGGKTSLRTGT
jgi:solute carrier family 35 protein